MLCRAVLTAVAISCTFSREVIGQGSPRKVQIKDLICVLWLSGMQKEDLDVNMLRKLQRHNVNIDDMSSESLKHECLNFKLGKDNATKKVKDKSDDDENTTTTEYIKQDNEKKVKRLLKNDLKILLSDFMNTKTTKAVEDKTFSMKKEATKKSMIPENYNKQNQKTDILVSFMGGDETDKFDLNYGNGQPVLGNIKNCQIFTTTPIPKKYYLDAKIVQQKGKPKSDEEKHQQKYIKPETRQDQQKETEYINKLLAAFIKTNIKPTTEKPTTASIVLKKLSDQIEKLLKLYPQSGTLGYSNRFPETEVEIVDNIQPDGYYFVKNGIPSAVSILDERIKQYDERSIKNKNIKVIRQLPIDIPKKIATLPISVPVQVLDNKQIEMRFQPLKEDEINLEPTNAPSTTITTTINDVTKKDGVNIITKDCIKEIAENVKAIVLKDLRHEVTATPISTSVVTTTTTIPTTTPLNQNKSSTALPSTGVTRENPPQSKTQEATQVIEKFMKLFEQFKSIKEKTEVTSEMKNLTNLTNMTHQESKNPFNVNYQKPMVVIDPNKVKKPPENTPGLYNSFAIQRPKIIQRFPTHGAKFVPIVPISVPSQSFPRTQVKPITIQTNSHEIRPLGIPISNPLKLIHQNIVVTTTHRYPGDKWVEKYQYKATTNRKERYKHYPITPRHAEHNDDAKPLDPKLYKDVRFDDFELFKDKAKKPFGPNHYEDERLPEMKHEFIDDTKSIDQRPYMNARLRELNKFYKEDATELYHKSYKYNRMPEFLDEKLLDKIPYKNERNRELDAKLSYQKPYDTSRFTSNHDISSLGKSPYDDFRSYKLHEDKIAYGEKPKHKDNISYGLLSQNRNSQRFHEKLERVDDWRDGLMGNTEDKKGNVEGVASRHQQPLHMKDSRFDDTHFKNFLKTQQKVNDMLEKILSSKTIQNGPLSVETA